MKKKIQLKKFAKVVALSLALSMTVQTVAPATTTIIAEAAKPNKENANKAKGKIKLNLKKNTIEVGESFTLKVSNTSKEASFTSSNKKVATVTESGEVTGVSKGKATITVTVDGKKYKCKVTVKGSDNKYVTNAPFEAAVAKVGKNSVVVPKTWSNTKGTVNGMKVNAFMPKDASAATGSSIYVTSVKSKVDNKNFDYYFSILKDSYTADTFKNMFAAQLTGQVTIEDFSITEEKIPAGRISVMSYSVKIDGKLFCKQKIYDVFAQGYTTEFTVTDKGVATTPDLYVVANYMMESLTFGK